MGLREDLQEAERRGIAKPTPTPTPTAADVKGDVGQGKSFADKISEPVTAAIDDPRGAALASVRGIQNAWGELVPGLVEHLEATGNFPLIRGAELAARMFVDDDVEPELTTYKDMVAESFALTEALKKRAPGWVEGAEYGVIAGSGLGVVKVIKNLSRKGLARASIYLLSKRSKNLKKGSTALAKSLLRQGDGPVLDAIVHRPDKVVALLEKDATLVDDLAVELGKDIERINKKLGENVGKFRAEFKVDPTRKVDVAEVRQMLSAAKSEMRTSGGTSLLTPKQQNRLDLIDELISGPGPERTELIEGAFKSGVVPPSDALKTIDRIDEMINIKEVEAGNISGDAFEALVAIRRKLKEQIRGNNVDWAKADELFSGFQEDAGRILSKVGTEGDIKLSRESFVNNLFGKGKTPTRELLGKVLNYGRHVDEKLAGSGDEFFRKLANIKGAEKMQDVMVQVSDPIQDNVNRIVQFWRNVGKGIGASAAGGAGLAAFGPMGGYLGAPAGWVIGAIAANSIGKKMANPARVLAKAQKAQSLDKQARLLASDLAYVHKTFGNDGVVAMMEIVKGLPATNALVGFVSGAPKEEKKR